LQKPVITNPEFDWFVPVMRVYCLTKSKQGDSKNVLVELNKK
jgi:hypothetical protein